MAFFRRAASDTEQHAVVPVPVTGDQHLDREGRADLHYAALEGRLDEMHACLKQGADPDLGRVSDLVIAT